MLWTDLRRDHVLIPTGQMQRGTCAHLQALLVKPSTTTSCSNQANNFPSGSHSARHSISRRARYRLPVRCGKHQFTCCWLTRTRLGPADDGDFMPSGTIGGRTDLALGVIETSLAALQTGSALATHVPFISPIAGLILQTLKMRGVRL